MNKNLLIGIGVVAIITVIGGVLLMGNKKDNENNDQQNEQNVAEEQGNVSVMEGKTLKDFMEGKLGENVTCNFSYKLDDGVQLDGVAYIAGKKARFDYNMQSVEAGQRESHMVMDEEYVYIWGQSFFGDAKPMGMKYKITEADQASTEAQKPTEQQSLDYEAPVTECRKWSPEAGLLAVPSDISFESIEDIQSAATQGVPDSGAASSGLNCSICDSVPAEQKATCLQGLGCK